MTICCEVCEAALDEEGLRSGALERICLECLSDEQRRALEHDLNSAAQIQAHLLPARNFSFGGWQINYHYQPLGAVSGDHIDLIRPDRTGDAMHFLFGDVAGKGVAASILMANLQALFRSLAIQDLPLAEMVARANRIFAESTPAHSYATLVAGRLDSRGGLELVNAGHNPPLLERNGSLSSLAAAALPLGFSAASRFASDHFTLEPDDFLFLYTDGVSESVNEGEDEYGAERIAVDLQDQRGETARGVVDSVLRGVRTFQNGSPRVDDVSAMAIRWRG